MITIYGHSDDLIEIAGDISDEINFLDDGVIAISNGVLLAVTYNGDWNFKILRDPNAAAKITTAFERGEEYYSDLVTVEGNIDWVVCSDSANLVSA